MSSILPSLLGGAGAAGAGLGQGAAMGGAGKGGAGAAGKGGMGGMGAAQNLGDAMPWLQGEQGQMMGQAMPSMIKGMTGASTSTGNAMLDAVNNSMGDVLSSMFAPKKEEGNNAMMNDQMTQALRKQMNKSNEGDMSLMNLMSQLSQANKGKSYAEDLDMGTDDMMSLSGMLEDLMNPGDKFKNKR